MNKHSLVRVCDVCVVCGACDSAVNHLHFFHLLHCVTPAAGGPHALAARTGRTHWPDSRTHGLACVTDSLAGVRHGLACVTGVRA